ncbi:MAG: YidC/Oxa1 family membrane protein insertase [Clostridiales bacterium]|nr:YidC/Oxa1 family membrane protein insertase [Clostridiales bacterium]
MAFLNSITNFIGAVITPSITKPDMLWHILILNVFSWIKDYGWSIVLFTVLLKLVLSPLDFFQRYKMHKNQRITERLKPTMEKIQKQYGNDKQAFQQKQMELNRKEGYSYFSSCLPMIVTMVVFITLWLSMQTVAQYMMFRSYARLYDAYTVTTTQVREQIGDTLDTDSRNKVERDFGQEVVYKLYYDGIDDKFITELCESEKFKQYGFKNIDISELDKSKVQASFLWIDNIWVADVPWKDSIVDNAEDFKSAIDEYADKTENGLKDDIALDNYEVVMGKLIAEAKANGSTNGYLILPILVVLLSFGSQLLTMFQQKRAGQVNNKGGMATSMKVMMFVMPVMMAVFAIQYASIFTLYMVTNTATTLFFNVFFTNIIKFADKRKRGRNYGISTGSPRTISYKQSPIVHYVKGANPDAGKRLPKAEPAADTALTAGEDKKSKKAKKAAANAVAVKRGGRPDPNDLMSMDLSKDNKKKK